MPPPPGDSLGERVELVGGHFVHVLVRGVGHGVDFDLGVTILAAAAGLADVFAFGGGRLANRFAVGHLRTAHAGLHVELAHHAIDDDFQV